MKMDALHLLELFDSLNIGVGIVDHEGKYIYFNSRIFQLSLCASYEELYAVGVKRWTANHSDSCLFDEVIAHRRPITRKQRFFSIDGRRLGEHLTYASPIFDEKDNITYVVYTVVSTDEYQQYMENAGEETQIVDTKQSSGDLSGKVIYQSQVMERLIQELLSVADSSASVMLLGETGTGKEIFARLLHEKSCRGDKEMIVINCASLPENLLDAELFGYEKGSFTGALTSGKAGLIEAANGSTLFLDEIDSLPYGLQSKLLRALESKCIRRIGGHRELPVDFRVVSATNANLYEAISEKQFRADLYYRLNTIQLMIPPLRDRKEDIPLLCQYFLAQFGKRYNKQKKIMPEAMQTMLKYEWPGNVRELRNTVERLVATSIYPNVIMQLSMDMIKANPWDLCRQETETAKNQAAKLPPDAANLVQALQNNGFNVSKAAKALGISRRSFYYKMKCYGITLSTTVRLDGGSCPVKK